MFDPNNITFEQQREFKERLAEMVAFSVGCIVIPDEQGIEQLFRDDAAMSPAIDFTGSFQVLGNVLGKDRRRCMSSCRSADWQIRGERRTGIGVRPEGLISLSAGWFA